MLPAWKALQTLAIPLKTELFAGASEDPANVARILRDNGYILREATPGNIDSSRFLKTNDAFVGYLLRGWTAIVYTGRWFHIDADEKRPLADDELPTLLGGEAYAVFRAWVPFLPFLDSPIYLRTPQCTKHERWELEPESFRFQRFDYRGRQQEIAHAISKFATPVLISNGTQVVVSTPTDDGWKTRKVFDIRCFPDDDWCDTIIARSSDALGGAPPHLDTYISALTAHALLACCRAAGVPVDLPDITGLEEYQESLEAATFTL